MYTKESPKIHEAISPPVLCFHFRPRMKDETT